MRMERAFSTSFLLSLLLHILFFLSIAMIISWQPITPKKSPDYYHTPAYIQKSSAMPVSASLAQPLPAKKQADTKQKAAQKPSKYGIAKSSATINKKVRQQSVLSMTYQFLQNNTLEKSEQDPIYLVGDKNAPADPLIRLLAAALSAHFAYPHEPEILGIRGKAIVGLTLHPSGRLTDIELLASTDNNQLDAAALYAVKKAPIVKGADEYITKPTYFVIGFIFR